MYLLKVFGLVDNKVKVVELVKFVKYETALEVATAFAACGDVVELSKNVENPVVFAN